MSLVFDLYVPGRSWLHKLDPRVKLWGVVVGIVMAFVLPYAPVQALLLAGIHALLLLAGIPWRTLRSVWRQMAVLVVILLLLQPFFKPEGALLLAAGPLRLTLGGLYGAVLLALRALVIAFIAGGLLFTTEQGALVRAFVRLGFPYTWGLTISLTLRFLPAIQNLFVVVRDAQAARGWVVEGNFFRRLREYLPVLIAVIIGTLRMSDQLTLALAARGLGAAHGRTVWHDLRMRRADWFAAVGLTLLLAGLLWRRLAP